MLPKKPSVDVQEHGRKNYICLHRLKVQEKSRTRINRFCNIIEELTLCMLQIILFLFVRFPHSYSYKSSNGINKKGISNFNYVKN